MPDRQFPKLRRAWDKRNAQWLEAVEEELFDALSDEVSDGASPDEVEAFIKQLSGDDGDRFAMKLKSAARHLESTAKA